ncbi:hypothetical protein JAAARDRAFT_107155, partial [Jaapia argillacea MUCL 33604]
PTWVAVWIMSKCDDIDPETNKVKGLDQAHAGYGTAQKMRASVSHMFSRVLARGLHPWMPNPMQPGKFIGNPSMSLTVSQYMISLRRRRVRAGEIVTSARAMDESTMKALYNFN